MRDRRLGRDGPFDAHPYRNPRIAADGTVDGTGGAQPAMRQRDVLAAHGARLQLAYQVGLGPFVARHHHQAGRVLVEPVHDAGTRHARQFGITVQQAVEQRAAPVARPGMRHQPRRLVHHDPIGAFGHHVESHRFGRESPAFRGRLLPDRQDVAGADRLAHLGLGAVYQNVTGLDPALQPAARMARQQPRQHLVQAVCRGIRRHREQQRFVVGKQVYTGGCIRHEDKSYNQPAMLTPRIGLT
ncbi:Uncharacterised protein [Bordetella pertussis]|nr:Uncharacterised protein [Bordetella pertussis]CFP04718.1 Uncharacterised protein [Bordetella pertussis]CPJ59101.1 Uncharacterised protein [Bordetella pertussis]CPQ01238.1 Uncharacterised protein [Bordetella pertussis]CRE26641.1 Uncharacterised protein [Bordetella pertussis]